MLENEDRRFPAALAAAMTVGFDYAGGDGVEFEPFEAFLTADETTEWFRAWTGNSELNGSDFRVFGQDGTGGYAAVWLTRSGHPLAEQPVVFLGSEGGTGVIADNLGAFLWVLAGGFGPLEAATSHEPGWIPHANAELTRIAEKFAPSHREAAATIIARATHEFPDFDDTITAICR